MIESSEGFDNLRLLGRDSVTAGEYEPPF